MSIIKALREWLAECPELQKLSKDGYIDFTKDEKENYGISPGGETTVRRYIDGSSIRQYSFSIFARRYTAEDVGRLENAEFLENLSRWMDNKALVGELPDLGDGTETQAVSSNFAALFEADQNGKTGLYQIPCEMIYRKKRREL